MRIGKELIGKPIYSVIDGRQLGSVKDLFLDLDLDILTGIFLGREGLINRKIRAIRRDHITVLGVDAVLVSGPDVVTDNVDTPEVELWLRRDELQGRDIDTAGGTKVGTVGDVMIDAEAHIVGFALAKVYVEGPVAEKRMVVKQAVIETGGKSGIITVDLTKAEQLEADTAAPAEDMKEEEALTSEEPAEEEGGEVSKGEAENDAETPSESEN